MSAYSEAKKWIKNATTDDIDILYEKIRDILSKHLNENPDDYPEDKQLKELQRLADAKYESLRKEAELIKAMTDWGDTMINRKNRAEDMER